MTSLPASTQSSEKKQDSRAAGGPLAPTPRASENTHISFVGVPPAPVVGALDANDSTYNRMFGNCTGVSATGTNVFYDTLTISNDSAGVGSFVVETSGVGTPGTCGVDTFLTVYSPTFDPANPAGNCVISNDDGGASLCSNVTFALALGDTAVVVVTSFSNGALLDYQVNFDGTTGDPLVVGLQVEGAIESTIGFRFPDGSVQVTAFSGVSALEAAAADSDEVGSRVLGACAVGWSIGSINADGTVVCEAIDADIADHAEGAEEHHSRNPDPPCFNMTQRFVDCRNGTVTDTVTGLTYLKSADCIETQTWSDANQRAKTLAAGQCGLTDGSVAGDWRLQTKEEWEALLDPSCPTAPKIAGDGVRGTCYTDSSWASGLASASHWSSGTDIDSPGNAWKPNLNSGIIEHDSKTSHNHAWPVRGGQ
jgi:hypothetical protein